MTFSPRAVCYACLKPQVTCVCDDVRKVENRTPVFVLQHPRERRHPVGTARLLALGLRSMHLEIAWNAGEREDAPPAWLPPDAALLYPTNDATPLNPAPDTRPGALVVIDGTWHTARTLFRDKTWLSRLPRLRLSPTSPSRYRIRKEPSPGHLSTVEATIQALATLEPETVGFDTLLAAFDRMIDRQLEYVGRGGGAARTKARRPAPIRKLPRALAEDFQRLVVVYVESCRREPEAPREIVQCAAVELATGRRFHRFVGGTFGPPSAVHLAHMGLSVADFVDAVSLTAFRRDWREFLGSAEARPVVAAWNEGTLDLLSEDRRPRSRSVLKNAYRTAGGMVQGSLDDVIARHGLAPLPEPFPGRAGIRVARAVAIARYLNARGRSAPE